MGLFARLARLARLIRDERGATAVEYALICSLIVLAIVAAITQVAGSTSTMWNSVSDNVAAVS